MQIRSLSWLLMIVSIAIAVLPVWRSPMISSRWPRPTGIIPSIAFSPVCTDQLQIYEEALEDFAAQGATLYGVSTDSVWAQKAFKEKLGVTIEQLSDFEPKGEMSRGFGAYFEPGGMTNRALVIVGPDGVVRWSHLADSPGDLPGVGLIFDGLAAAPVS